MIAWQKSNSWGMCIDYAHVEGWLSLIGVEWSFEGKDEEVAQLIIILPVSVLLPLRKLSPPSQADNISLASPPIQPETKILRKALKEFRDKNKFHMFCNRMNPSVNIAFVFWYRKKVLYSLDQTPRLFHCTVLCGFYSRAAFINQLRTKMRSIGLVTVLLASWPSNQLEESDPFTKTKTRTNLF